MKIDNYRATKLKELHLVTEDLPNNLEAAYAILLLSGLRPLIKDPIELFILFKNPLLDSLELSFSNVSL